MKPPPFMLPGSPLNLEYFFPHETHCYDEVMKALPKDRHRIAIDIGSCEGLWAINLAEEFDTVHAFEPMPDMLEISKRWLPKNVIPYNYALSNAEASHEMVYFEHNVGMTMKTEGMSDIIKNHMKDSPSRTFIAQYKTLDSFDFENIDFIKLDAEGEDLNVLEGAKNTIEKCKPLILIDSEEQYDIPGYKWYAMIRDKEYSTIDQKKYIGAWLYTPEKT